jgi:hypothetical protein
MQCSVLTDFEITHSDCFVACGPLIILSFVGIYLRNSVPCLLCNSAFHFQGFGIILIRPDPQANTATIIINSSIIMLVI